MAQASASSCNIPSDSDIPALMQINNITIAFPTMGAVPEEGPVHYSLAQLAEAADLNSDDQDSDLYFTDSSMSYGNDLKRARSLSDESLRELDLKRTDKQAVSIVENKKEIRAALENQSQGKLNYEDEDQSNREVRKEYLENDVHDGSEDIGTDLSTNEAQTNLKLSKKSAEEEPIKNAATCWKNNPLKRSAHEENREGSSTKKSRFTTPSSCEP